MKTIAAFAAAAFAAAALVIGSSGSPTAAAQDGGKPVLTIGLQQGIDNMNPIRGYTVAAFEAWNMQYATLTDKKAEDFSIAPGLAESWEGEGQEYTYTLRPDLKWSDGQPLTAEDVAWTINTSRDEEWLNHFATTGKLTAEAVSDTEALHEADELEQWSHLAGSLHDREGLRDKRSRLVQLILLGVHGSRSDESRDHVCASAVHAGDLD